LSEEKKIVTPGEYRKEQMVKAQTLADDLARVSVGLPPVRYVPIKSCRFKCRKCDIPVIELTPVIPKAANPKLLKKDKRYFEAILQCPNDCHLRPGFATNNMYPG